MKSLEAKNIIPPMWARVIGRITSWDINSSIEAWGGTNVSKASTISDMLQGWDVSHISIQVPNY
eukprot:187898-Karenia_brevis.AAC.1